MEHSPIPLRASDADRQAAADRLRVALNEGRIDLAEYDERLALVYAARTYEELDRPLADLPRVRSAPAPASGDRPRWRVQWFCCLPIPVRQP